MYPYTDTKNKYFDVNVDDDNDEADETKRKTRNLSEKKRRDQFNTLIRELNDVVSPTSRKMDKSTVLKTAINNLKSSNKNLVRSKDFELDEDFKPSFITNEEYLFLLLQSVDGFFITFSSCGKILCTSDNLAFVLGYQLNEVLNTNIYDIISRDDRTHLENLFLISTINNSQCTKSEAGDNLLHFNCKLMKKSALYPDGSYEPVEFVGDIKIQEIPSSASRDRIQAVPSKSHMFVGFARLLRPTRYPEISLNEHLKTEFVSHHNVDWKFIFMDERAPSIVGYSPFEVLGRSGYEYYHVDDLESICAHHKTLMTQDQGVSGYYRFLTKGCEWIWLQTKSYINRRQWNSRVEFIVCTHTVVNPLMPKNEMEAKFICLNQSTMSLSSNGPSSMTGSSGSNKTSTSSRHSTTASESNYYEENDSLQWSCEGYYSDDRMSSSTSISRERFNENFETNRKCYRQHRPARRAHTITSGSSSPYCFQYSTTFVNTPPKTAVISDCKCHNATSYRMEEMSGSSSSNFEDSLQKKCNELQQIIANRTEELRVVSEQLYTTRKANQQKSDGQYYSLTDSSIINEENESSIIIRHFANICDTSLCSDLAENQ